MNSSATIAVEWRIIVIIRNSQFPYSETPKKLVNGSLISFNGLNKIGKWSGGEKIDIEEFDIDVVNKAILNY